MPEREPDLPPATAEPTTANSGVLFKHGLVFDGVSDDLQELDVLVRGNRVVEVGPDLTSHQATTINLAGKVLLPGLIDAHVHVYAYTADLSANEVHPITLVAHDARRMLEESLRRGFTSLRDAGGADFGLRMALDRGLINGPRLFYCGKALSQTGGHGDFRRPWEAETCGCAVGHAGHISRVVDGPDEVRRAVREELRRGASFIKICASGGVSSPSGNLNSSQFSPEEVRAVVDEVERQGTYVTAHVIPDDAIRRAIELGVHCIEHGLLMSDATAKLAFECGTAVVPTLAIVRALARFGRESGYPDASLAKLRAVEPRALESLEVMVRAKLRIGFGTDLIGNVDRHQCTEFLIRSEVMQPADILRSATSINAEIIGEGGRLGQVAPGFLADLIVVNGNPLADLSLFDENGSRVPIVMKDGILVKS